jgi:hypothetical protein
MALDDPRHLPEDRYTIANFDDTIVLKFNLSPFLTSFGTIHGITYILTIS